MRLLTLMPARQINKERKIYTKIKPQKGFYFLYISDIYYLIVIQKKNRAAQSPPCIQ